MKIKRDNNGSIEWLAAVPVGFLADDGVTVDRVETAWTFDESSAYDFTARVPTAMHARDIAAQLDGMGCEFPPEWYALPEPAPPPSPTPPPPPVRVESRVTPEGRARRDAVAALTAQAKQHTDLASAVEALAEAAAPGDALAIAGEASAVVASALETAAAADAAGAREVAQAARDAAARAAAVRTRAEQSSSKSDP